MTQNVVLSCVYDLKRHFGMVDNFFHKFTRLIDIRIMENVR